MKSFPEAKLFISQQRHRLFLFKFCNPAGKGIFPIEVFAFEITVYRDAGLIVNSVTWIVFKSSFNPLYGALTSLPSLIPTTAPRGIVVHLGLGLHLRYF